VDPRRERTVNYGIAVAVTAGVTVFMYTREGLGGAVFALVVAGAAFVLALRLTARR
jgi:hypothetical protein